MPDMLLPALQLNNKKLIILLMPDMLLPALQLNNKK